MERTLLFAALGSLVTGLLMLLLAKLVRSTSVAILAGICLVSATSTLAFSLLLTPESAVSTTAQGDQHAPGNSAPRQAAVSAAE